MFTTLQKAILPTNKTIWIHCASLGEFEQGLPIITALKKQYNTHKIIVTFFSPSGYEVQKNNPIADVICYLPLDTPKNAQRFLGITHPELVVFIKYEFWPNYLQQLQKNNIPTLLVSGIFRKDQSFFKWYGKWMQQYLNTFNHFFVQNNTSKELLAGIGFTNSTISGDTRFDRVSEIISRDNTLDFINEFKNNNTTIVYGSSWADDENIYLKHLNNSTGIKHIIAPHTITPSRIQSLQEKISLKTVLYSEYSNKNLADYDVFIIDTIGLLTKIYSYADIAYVGGGFKTGLHNTLEPAVFGTPIIIGPKYHKFQEAIDLIKNKGTLAATNEQEYTAIINQLITDCPFRTSSGEKNNAYITQNTGTTAVVLEYISTII